MLTLDQQSTYQIKVHGHLDESWLDCDGGMMVTIRRDENGLLPPPVKYPWQSYFADLAALLQFSGIAIEFGYIWRLPLICNPLIG